MWTYIQDKIDDQKLTLKNVSNLTGISYNELMDYKHLRKPISFSDMATIARILNINIQELADFSFLSGY